MTSTLRDYVEDGITRFSIEELSWLPLLGFVPDKTRAGSWNKGDIHLLIAWDWRDLVLGVSFSYGIVPRAHEKAECDISCLLSHTGYRGRLLFSLRNVHSKEKADRAFDDVCDALLQLIPVLNDVERLRSAVRQHARCWHAYTFNRQALTIGCGAK